MKKIKILQAIREANTGGGESHMFDLCKYLDKNTFDPVALSFTDGVMIDNLKEIDVPTKVIPTLKPFDYKIWKEVKAFMQEEQFDIVHAHGTRAMSNVFWAARSLGIPLLYSVHGWSFHPTQGTFVRKLRQLSEKLLTQKADLTICVSNSNEADGKKYLGMKRSRVINYGIDLDRFNPNKEFKNIREELNIPENKIVIGYIVRITEQKDPLTMINAMSIVFKEFDNVVLLVVGDGDLKNEMKAQTKALNIEDNVIFQPFRSDVPDLLNTIDVYCLPSLWEGLSIGVLEALAMKTAAVTAPVDGNKEVIINQKTGLLAENQNPKKLAEALKLLISNPELREKLASNGHELVVPDFSKDRLIYDIENLYNKYQTRFV
jgi:glycosyltransferase involved in cell wall biosynthesis